MEQYFEKLKEKALQGDAESQLLYAVSLHNFDIPERSLTEALKWYLKAADQDHPDACFMTFFMLARPKGPEIKQDFKRALFYLEKAHTLGHPKAAFELGSLYVNAVGVERDLKKAFQYFSQAAQVGDERAYNSLGGYYAFGYNGTRDYKTAISWLEKAIEADNNPASHYLLAEIYELGSTDIPRDEKRAFKHLIESAKQGFNKAAVKLMFSYFNGTGVEKDFKKVLTYALQADPSESPEVYSLTARVYLQGGYGVEPNFEKGITLLEKGVAAEEVNALQSAAELYETGQIYECDYKKALDLYQRSVDKGNVLAYQGLARMHRFGLGVPKDIKKAEDFEQKHNDGIAKIFGPRGTIN